MEIVFEDVTIEEIISEFDTCDGPIGGCGIGCSNY